MFKLTALICLFSISCFSSLKEMTLEEKVGQLLMVHFNGETVNDDAKTLIQKAHVGSFIYYNWANGLHSPEQVKTLSSDLQKLAKIPLLIAADQEGGVVARLNQGFTIFPGNKALGMTRNPELAEESAFAIGQELLSVGVNFNLAPVVDVNCNPRNPVIGIRSFADSPDVVLSFARSALQGYKRSGIKTSLKHFPGHGDVQIDSHEDLPVVHKSKEELDKVELLPFSQLAGQADTVMTAHLIVPSIDPKNCATLSKAVLDILRKEIGFKGVIISDSLVMEGLLKNCTSIDDAAMRAINAGCDLLILGGKQLIGAHAQLELTVADVLRIHQSLVDAVKKGQISEERLNQAVQRVLDLKKDLPAWAEKIDPASHQALAKKIATLALKNVKNKPVSIHQKWAIFAPEIVRGNVAPLLSMGKETHSFFFKDLNPTEEEAQAAHDIAKKADVIVFCSYNAWKMPSQADLIRSMLTEKPTVLIVLRDPLDATLFPNAAIIMTTFSPTAPSIQAACDALID